MSKGLRNGLIVVGVFVAAAALLLAGVGLAGAYWGAVGAWPSGLMRGAIAAPPLTARQGLGAGMMGSFGAPRAGNPGYVGMGSGMMGSGMMGAGGSGGSGLRDLEPLTLEAAQTALADYLASLANDDLHVGEIMIFDNHAYARIVETSTGIGALEVLVDPVTLGIHPEPGPNMMWNLKYSPMAGMGFRGAGAGMMGGMRGWSAYGSGGALFGTADPTAEMAVTAKEAVAAAQAYLDRELPGTEADEHPEPFYGYYTLDILRDGEPVGMLSVHGTVAEVFLHTWHGDFIEMAEDHPA